MSKDWDLLGDHLLPFSLRLDKQGRCLSAGEKITKLIKQSLEGKLFTDFFKVVYPQSAVDQLTFDDSGHIKVTVNDSIQLAGDYQVIDENVFLVFNPDVSSLSDLIASGLSLGDLPQRSVIGKYLFLKNSLDSSNKENLLLIEALQKEKKGLSETNQLLNQSILAGRAAVFKFIDGEFQFLNSSKEMERFGFHKGRSTQLKDLLDMTNSKHSYFLSNFFHVKSFGEFQKSRIEFPVFDANENEVWVRADVSLSEDKKFLIGILIDINYEKEIEHSIRKSEVTRSRQFGLQVHDKLSTSLVGLRMLIQSGDAQEEVNELLGQIIEYSRGIMNALNIDYFKDIDKRESFEQFIRNVGKIQDQKVKFTWHEEHYFTQDSTDYFIFQSFQEIVLMSLGRPKLNEVVVSSSHNLCLILLKVDQMPKDQLSQLQAFTRESQGVTSQVIVNEVNAGTGSYEMAFTFNR